MPLRPLSELTPCPITWLWPGRLALGKLALLEGDPGLSKSLVALDLCARLSTGRPFPDGSPAPGPANCIHLTSEDVNEDTVLPRLQTLGADLARIFVVKRESDDEEPLLFPGQAPYLDDELTRTRARLVVIDVVVDFLDPRVSVNYDASVRRALRCLAELARKHHCVILLLRHLNKRIGGRSVYRGSGAIGLIGACRSAWLIAEDPDDSTRCVLAQVKNNLAPPQPSLAYTVEGLASTAPVVNWLGPSPWTAAELHATRRAAPPRIQPRETAADFLLDLLKEGPCTSREVWDAAQALGLAQRTLNRAKEDLGIRSERVPGTVTSYWLLPDQRLPGPRQSENGEPDVDDWLADLRAQYPPPTPLDEE
jgi:hypothetical protein